MWSVEEVERGQVVVVLFVRSLRLCFHGLRLNEALLGMAPRVLSLKLLVQSLIPNMHNNSNLLFGESVRMQDESGAP